MSRHVFCLALPVLLCLAAGSSSAATRQWVAAGSGSWGDAANWSGGVVPQTGDDVEIDVAGAVTVTLSTGTFAIGSLDCAETLVITGGSLALGGDSTVATLTQSGGTIRGTGKLTVTNGFTWNGGQHGQPGEAGETLVTGPLTITAGPNYLYVYARTLRVTGNAAASLTTSGSRYVSLQSGARLEIGATRTFEQGDGEIYGANTGERIVNAGVWKKVGTGEGRIQSSLAFDNAGAVQVLGGTLALLGGGTSTGSFDSGDDVVALNGSHGFASVALAGAIALQGGTLTLTGTPSAAAADMTLSSGTLELSTDLSLASLEQTGGTVRGTGKLSLTNGFTWTGGQHGQSGEAGETLVAGPLSITGTNYLYLYARTLRVSGNAAASLTIGNNRYLQLQSGARLEVGATRTFEQGDVEIVGANTGERIVNAGVWKKVGAGEGRVQTSLAFDNTGTVQVTAGTLALLGGGTSTGPFQGAANTTLRFGGTHSLGAVTAPNVVVDAGSTTFGGAYSVATTTTVNGAAIVAGGITAGGAWTITGGTAQFNVAASLASLTQSGGVLRGVGKVTVTNAFTWTGGQHGQSGEAGETLVTGPLAIMAGPSNYLYLYSRTLRVTGNAAASLSGSNGRYVQLQSGARLEIEATRTIEQGDGDIYGANSGERIVNAGVWKKVGTGESRVQSSVAFDNTGTVQITGGTLALLGGGTSTGSFDAGDDLLVLSGSHGFDSVEIAGAVALQGGTLAFTGTPSTAAADVTIPAGTLILSTDVALHSLDQSSGVVRGTGKLTVTNGFTWTGGQHGQSGEAGETIVTGPLAITAGPTNYLYLYSRTLRAIGNAPASLAGSNSRYVQFGSGARLEVAATRTFELGDGDINGANSGERVVNAGVWKKVGGGEARLQNVRFDNTGTVQVATGTLALLGGGDSTGPFQGAANTTLRFAGTHTLAAVTAPNVVVDGGSTTFGGVYSAATTTASAGTAIVAGSVVAGGSWTVTNGTAQFDVAASLASLTQSGGVVRGTGTVTVTNAFAWTGGQHGQSGEAGETVVNGPLTITAGPINYLYLYARALRATGNAATSVSGSNTRYLQLQFGARLEIGAGRTVEQGAGDIQGANNGERVVNAGIWKKVGGGEARLQNVRFDNAGTVQVTAGTLALLGGGTSTGPFQGAAGTTLRLAGAHGLAAITAPNVVVEGGSVTFGGAYSAATTTVSAGTAVVAGSVTAGGAWTITSGAAEFDVAASLASLTQSGGVLRGAGTVTVTNGFTWSGGQHGQSGEAGETLVTGPLTMQAGPSDYLYLYARTLRATGNAAASLTGSGGRYVQLYYGGRLEIGAGRTFEHGDVDIYGANAGERIVNAGVWKKVGAGEARIQNLAFDNAGTVQVAGGSLALLGGGTSTGPFQAAGRSLSFGGNHTLGGLVEAGTAAFTSGMINVNGGYAASQSTNITGGTVRFAGTVSKVGDTLAVSGGSASFETNGEIALGAVVLSGGSIAGRDRLRASGGLNWTSGQLGASGTPGELEVSGTTTLDGQGSRTITNHVLVNKGTMTLKSTLYFSGASLRNLSGATLTLDGNAQVYGSGTVSNEGALKTSGGGSVQIQPVCNGAGSIDVPSGTLHLTGGGTIGGKVGASGGTIDLGGGTFVLNGAVEAQNAVFSGGTATMRAAYKATNATRVTGGTARFEGQVESYGEALIVESGTAELATGTDATVANLEVTNGTLKGDDAITAVASFAWGGGRVELPELVTAGIATWSGTGTKSTLGTTLRNTGRVTLGEGNLHLEEASRLENSASGAFVVLLDADITGAYIYPGSGQEPPVIDNAGSFTKLSGATSTDIYPPFTNRGTVRVASGTLTFHDAYKQSAGKTEVATQLEMQPSYYTGVSAPFELDGGELTGAGEVTGVVENDAGIVSPGASPGALRLTGEYRQGPGGRYVVELAGTSPGTQHDQLLIAGPAKLAGTLEVRLRDDFVPSPTDTFAVLTGSPVTGRFASVTLPPHDQGPGLAVRTSATTVRLEPAEGEVCDDAGDNDGDGVVDCADSDCAAAVACVGTTSTTLTSATTTTTTTTISNGLPEDCANGVDDDADGAVDCRDDGCADRCTDGCALDITFPALRCRFDGLSSVLGAFVNSSKVGVGISGARAKFETAASKCADGKAPPAKRKLKMSAKQLDQSQKLLFRSPKKGVVLAPEIVTALQSRTPTLANDLRRLRSSLSCSKPRQ